MRPARLGGAQCGEQRRPDHKHIKEKGMVERVGFGDGSLLSLLLFFLRFLFFAGGACPSCG